MSEKTFTRSEVENALDIAILGVTGKYDPEELNEKLDGISPELKCVIATKYMIALAGIMGRDRQQQPRRCSDPVSEFLNQFKESQEEHTCSKCRSKEEEPRVHIFKNGRPMTKEDEGRLFNMLKGLFED